MSKPKYSRVQLVPKDEEGEIVGMWSCIIMCDLLLRLSTKCEQNKDFSSNVLVD